MRLVKYFAHEHHLSPPQVFTDLTAFPAVPPRPSPIPGIAGVLAFSSPVSREGGRDHPRAAPGGREGNPRQPDLPSVAGMLLSEARGQRSDGGNTAAGVGAVGRQGERGSCILQGFFFCSLHSPYLVGL